jgi:hypothetical protein
MLNSSVLCKPRILQQKATFTGLYDQLFLPPGGAEVAKVPVSEYVDRSDTHPRLFCRSLNRLGRMENSIDNCPIRIAAVAK